MSHIKDRLLDIAQNYPTFADVCTLAIAEIDRLSQLAADCKHKVHFKERARSGPGIANTQWGFDGESASDYNGICGAG